MLQRVQTVYLGIAIILLAIVSSGSTLFSFISESNRTNVNVFGLATTELKPLGMKTSIFIGAPYLFIFVAILTILCFICLMSYKNINRQFKLGRTIFFLYFLSVVGMIVLSFIGDNFIEETTTKRELGLGFYLLIIGFPFTFLANIGIKRDKRLLDSLDRLR